MTRYNIQDQSSPDYRDRLGELPEFNKYKKIVDDFFSSDLNGLSKEEIRKKFVESIKVFPQIVQILDQNEISKFHPCRIRVVDPSRPVDELLTRSFSYPDPNLIRENGRANISGTSVFYCGDDWLTALREVQPGQDYYAYYSRWTVKCNRVSTYRGFLPRDKMPKHARTYAMAEKYLDVFKQFNEDRQIGSKVQHMEYVFNKVADMFTSEPKPYNFSSQMAFELLYELNGIDFIMYPSWATGFEGTNFAFHPNFVDQYFSLQFVIKLHVKKLVEGEFNFTPIGVGELTSTNISWRFFQEEDGKLLRLDAPKNYRMKLSPINKT